MAEIGTTNMQVFNDKFNGVYRGTVVDNDDPSQLGRIKVRVEPMFKDIEDADLLPWAVPAYPIVTGAGSGIGYFAVPDEGTRVYVLFEQGDVYQPIYFAEAVDGVNGIPSDRTTNYPDTRVVKFSSGIKLVVNDALKTVTLTHPQGAVISIGATGIVSITGTAVTITGTTVAINTV